MLNVLYKAFMCTIDVFYGWNKLLFNVDYQSIRNIYNICLFVNVKNISLVIEK